MKKLLIAAALIALTVPAVATSATSERATKRVSAYNNYFAPKKVTVRKGTKVVWTIRQGVHEVDGGYFESPYLSKGKTYSKKFKRRGVVRYHCEIHPGMTGKVVVR